MSFAQSPTLLRYATSEHERGITRDLDIFGKSNYLGGLLIRVLIQFVWLSEDDLVLKQA